MEPIVDLLFEARQLKATPRSGFQFLGAGRESVAEHSFQTAFIALVMARLEPEANALRLISMCLLHDLAEARTGDLNTVNKRYARADEDSAWRDLSSRLPFGADWRELMAEFNAGQTPESRLARDADQLAFILDLKALADVGFTPPLKWLPPVMGRLKTTTGRRLAEAIRSREGDAWWWHKTVDSERESN